MTTQKCPAILHVRDFIDQVGPDPTRVQQPAALQIQSTLNIPYEQDMQPDDVQFDPIPLRVYFYATPGLTHPYEPNAFFYAWGAFNTHIADGKVEIALHAHQVHR